MALNEDIPEEVRTNIRMFTMPVIDGGKGTAADIAAWNGGGYGVERQILVAANRTFFYPSKLKQRQNRISESRFCRRFIHFFVS